MRTNQTVVFDLSTGGAVIAAVFIAELARQGIAFKAEQSGDRITLTITGY